jgi:AcrR family transcriptional regulator
MSKPTARERLAEAAFALFDERGYEQTTVDDITERAGLGRTTFFRHYPSKDDVIFPDHDRMLEEVAERLRTTSQDTALAAVSDAVRLVLLHYLAEGELARRRYALTSRVPALRDREIATVARYQRLFREFIAAGLTGESGGAEPGSGELTALRAELMAAAVVAAHNHILRRWLRGESADPVPELDDALRLVIAVFTAGVGPVSASTVPASTVFASTVFASTVPASTVPASTGRDGGTTIVAFRAGQDIDALLPELRRLAAQ